MTQSDTKRQALITPRTPSEELSAIANDIRAPIRQIEEQSELLLQDLESADRTMAVQTIRSAVSTLKLVLDYLDKPNTKDREDAPLNQGQLSTHAILRTLAGRLAFAADQHDVHFELEADIDLPLLTESDAELTKRALMRVIEYLIRVVGSGGSIHLHCQQPHSTQALALEIELNPQGEVAPLFFGISTISDLRALIDDEGAFDDAAACLGGLWRVGHGDENILKLTLDNSSLQPGSVEINSIENSVPQSTDDAQILAMEEGLVQVEAVAHRFDLGREAQDSTVGATAANEQAALGEAIDASTELVLASSNDGILGSAVEPNIELPKILIVDENSISQKLLVRMLDPATYNIVIELDARNILNRLSSETFAAILIDCRLAALDSYNLVSQIRDFEKSTARVATRIVGMSSNLEKDSSERCRKAGMNSFISKPVSRTALNQAIQGTI